MYTPSEDAETLLFLGCVASYQEFRIPPALISIMNTAGVKYRTLEEKENCCGYLNYLLGSGFEDAAERNRTEIDGVRPKRIVTTCAGCYRTLKDLYPKVLDGWDYEMITARRTFARFVGVFVAEGDQSIAVRTVEFDGHN